MSHRNTRALRRAALWLVGINFVTVVLHSVAHEALGVKATAAQLVFIVAVIFVAPLAAAVLLPRAPRAAALALAAAMTGSLLFGLYYHFVADTIDHVAHVARMEPAFWAGAFRLTAILLLVFEAAGAAAAALLAFAARPQTFKHYAARTDF